VTPERRRSVARFEGALVSHTLANGIKVETFLDTSDFRETGFGLKQKRYTLGEEGDETRPIFLITYFPPNAVLPRHHHGDVFMDVVVQGTSNLEGETHGPGTVRWFPKECDYGHITAGPEGCTLLEFYTDQPGFAVTIDQDALTDDMKAEMARIRARASQSA
jgi:hypothetical protein